MNEELVAPKEKKRISKGKIILILILVVILAAAATVGVLFLKHYNSPAAKIARAEAAGDVGLVEELFEEYAEVLATDPDTATLYSNKLDELQRSFLEGTVDYDDAIEEINRIQTTAIPGLLEKISTVRSFVSDLNKSRTEYDTAEGLFASENYPAAIEHYKLVIEADPNYADAKAKISTSHDNYRTKMLADAEAQAAAGSYTTAITILESALNVLPNDSSITTQINFYKTQKLEGEISNALTEGSDYAALGDYANAIRAIKDHFTANPTNSTLSTRYAEYTAAYEAQVLTASDALAAERKYDEAIDQLKSAQSLLPDSQAVKDKLTALEASKPVPLSNLGAINGGWNWNEGTPEDPFGNNYSGSTNFTIQTDHDSWGDPRTISAEYRVDGKYAILSGKLIPYTSIHENSTYQVLVYTDDGSNNYQLVYTSPEIGRKTDPYSFEAPIAGAKYVKINIVLGDESAAILTDLVLWPN